MTMTRSIFSLFAAVALLVGMSAAAFAQQTPYDVDNPPAVSGSAETAGVGDDITVEATGLFPGEAFDWVAQYNPVIASGSGTSNAAGVAEFDFEVPQEAAGETIVVSVVGEQSGPLPDISIAVAGDQQEEVVAGDDGDAAAEDGDEDLARTGTETVMFILGGLLLVGIGGAALVMARRRDQSAVGV